jgi:integrase/predicted DNA-binding transcriptional regulator AlpA
VVAKAKVQGGFVDNPDPDIGVGHRKELVTSDMGGAITDERRSIGVSSRASLASILYVQDIAQLLGRSEKAVRSAISRGRLPPLRKIGGRACWLRQDLLELEAEIRGGKPAPMQINVSPYNYKNSARMLVTFTIPADKPKGRSRLRQKRVAPEGLDVDGALAWARKLEREVWSELMGKEKVQPVEEIIPAPAPAARSSKTIEPVQKCPLLREFWARFESEYLATQKPNTRKNYGTAWRRYIRPILGGLPLDAIDRQALGLLRSKLGKLKAQSRNDLLGKLRAALRQAESWYLIDEVPTIKAEKTPRRPKPVVFTEEEAERLIEAAWQKGGDAPAFVLILLHAGLRSSEVRALRWGDIDLRKMIVQVQHNYSNGEEATPKGGEAAPVGLSPELADALRALHTLRGGGKDDHVFTRWVREGNGKGQVQHHTPNTITSKLNQLQVAAGLEKSGPHRLRHTGLTILAAKGTNPYKLQKHARHAKLETTQGYVHLAAEQAAREAAAMWGDTRAPNLPQKPQNGGSGATLAN